MKHCKEIKITYLDGSVAIFNPTEKVRVINHSKAENEDEEEKTLVIMSSSDSKLNELTELVIDKISFMKKITDEWGTIYFDENNEKDYLKINRKLSDEGDVLSPNCIIKDTKKSISTVYDPKSDLLTSMPSFDFVHYAVAAINKFGSSPLTLINELPVKIIKNHSIYLTFEDGGGTVPATSYVIYRSFGEKDYLDATFYPILWIFKKSLENGWDGAPKGSVRDRGRIITN